MRFIRHEKIQATRQASGRHQDALGCRKDKGRLSAPGRRLLERTFSGTKRPKTREGACWHVTETHPYAVTKAVNLPEARKHNHI
jgi:hypothetical protein